MGGCFLVLKPHVEGDYLFLTANWVLSATTAAYSGKIRKIAFKFQFELARHRRYPDCGVSADDAIGCLGLRAKIQLNLIQMKRQRFTNGAIVKIPLGDGTHTYGRLMIAPYIEVYDSRTREELEISEILESPVLFTAIRN